MEQLNLAYHQLVSAESILKIDLQVNEKKLIRKNNNFTKLQRELALHREKIEEIKKKNATIKQEKEDALRMSMAPKHSNIQRVIKGGGRATIFANNRNPRFASVYDPLFHFEETKS